MLSRQLSDDAEDVVLAHDQELFAIDFDFGAAVFRNQHLVPFLHGEIHLLALFVHLTGAESDHFAFLWFFFFVFGLSRRSRLAGPSANCFRYFFLSSSTTSNSASTTSPSRRAAPSP